MEAARQNPITDTNKSNLCEAAEKLKNCTRNSDTRNAQHLWFHAGTCLERAGKINEASKAYVTAQQYERAIQILLEKERFGRVVPILLDHKDKLDPDLWNSWLDQCRLYYVQRADYDSLRPLFKDINTLLAFTIDRGYQSQYADFLEHNQRFYQLAHVYQKQNLPVKALEFLLREYHLRGETYVLNEATQLVVSQAEWVLALDRSRDQASAIVLDEMIQSIDCLKQKLTGRRQKELALIRAISKNSLRLQMVDDWKTEREDDRLWRARILHSVLKDTAWLSSRFEPDILQFLDAWFDYHSIMKHLIGDNQPSGSTASQRLLGFKPLSAESLISSKMIVAEGSIIARAAQVCSAPTQRNQYGELLISRSWIDRIVKTELIKPLKKQLFEIYSGLKRHRWTSPIRFSPYFATLSDLRGGAQATTSDKKFPTRIKLITTAIRAFSPICGITHSSSTTSGLLLRWARCLFESLYPANGTMEHSDLISPQSSNISIEAIRTCLRELVVPSALRTPVPTAGSITVGDPGFSTLVMCYSLALHLPGGLSLLASDDPPKTSQYLARFFNWNDPEGLTKGTLAIRNALREDGPLDAAVMVHFIEAITCDAIYHCGKAGSHSEREDGFSGLILPFSWTRCLAKRYTMSGVTRDADCFDDLLSVINMVSNQLKDKQTQRWFVNRESLSDRLDMVHILNLRL
ncbi:unnamed protein product [Rhizoctonia solani]|uniref:Uncharacterized protein n=1 Tax=Rhizoctonia solani TaxID=456999 RepID=A0A8H3EBX9_9AGAM|nr:unnamed protein product [Rhizoctonia solani]